MLKNETDRFHSVAALERRSVCREELLKNAPPVFRGGVFRPLGFRSLLEIGALVSLCLRRPVKPVVALEDP